MHKKTANLYDDDELIFAQDDNFTKFRLCRTCYRNDENGIVHIIDDVQSNQKSDDEYTLPSGFKKITDYTNNSGVPGPSSGTLSSPSLTNTDVEGREDKDQKPENSDEKDMNVDYKENKEKGWNSLTSDKHVDGNQKGGDQ